MTTEMPFIRDQGSGPGVLCLHSNASTSSQWRALADRLQDRFRVLAVDGYGAGKSPDWPTDRPMSLAEEVRLLAPALDRAGDRVQVVGHSYGAAVAIQLALMQPSRVRSLVLYEPTLFQLVARGGDPTGTGVAGIWSAANDSAAAIERGDLTGAAQRFIDFWMGPGSWAAMPASRQPAVAQSMRHAAGWRDVTFGSPVQLDDLRRLTQPMLLMWGDRSPESALSVVQVLREALPSATLAPQPGLGHMGPITHAESVNAQIEAFLLQQAG